MQAVDMSIKERAYDIKGKVEILEIFIGFGGGGGGRVTEE